VAKVIESGGVLTLKLSRLEKMGALHGDISVASNELISKTEVPRILLGTMRFKGGKDFCAIYKRTPAVIYEFADAPFKRWIVSI
jgi:hypothetical protein